MSTTTKDIDFDMEELVDFDDAVTTALKESGIAPITKANVEVKEERVKGNVKIVKSMFGSIAIQPKALPVTDPESLIDSEKATVLTKHKELNACINFERTKIVHGSCPKCGRLHTVSQCLWVKELLASGLLLKNKVAGMPFPFYNLI